VAAGAGHVALVGVGPLATPSTKVAWDSLALTKDQAVIALTEEASDL
jgi:hypothetical protein